MLPAKLLFRAMQGPAAMDTRKKVAVAVLAVSAAGVTSIKYYEGEVRKVYLDPVNIPTVCVGHASTVTSKDVGRVFSPEQCTELLRKDIQVAEKAVKSAVQVPVTQEQYDALVSFTFNVGSTNFRKSTLLRKLNAGDCWGAGAEFPKWKYAQDQELPGLVARRANERATFETGCGPQVSQ